ncbi:uncharacterized protein LOC143029227 isoform X2 [Oratosquilla oratoria]|uniref:uncharacterized protein LOC143029227 isoform X2 n=1 Tax=Oratosquilla oratoria TaxID=337810 RepID=UPI003F777EBC
MKLSIMRKQPRRTVVVGVMIFGVLLVYLTVYPETVHTRWMEGPRMEKGPRSKSGPGAKDSISKNGSSSGALLINTPGYQLPLLRPWDASLRPFLKKALDPSKDLACSKGIPEFSWSEGNKVSLKMDLLQRMYPGAKCCYSAITRVQESLRNYSRKADSKFRLEEHCYLLKKATTVIHAPAIYVKCIHNKTLLYKNIHHLINLKPLRKKMVEWREEECDRGSCTSQENGRSKKTEKVLDVTGEWGIRTGKVPGTAQSEVSGGRKTRIEGDGDPYSVVIFGIDSVSRQNLQRYMPKTFEFLKRSAAVDFQGFNKVADNTFPNLMPILVGKSGIEVKEECLGGNPWKAFDSCPFIWKNFSSRGYLTVYAEDTPTMGIFNYMHTGFVKQPTDLYLRYSLLASEDFIGHNGRLKPWTSLGKYCLGPRSSYDVIRQYSVDVAKTLGRLPYFGLFWTSKITHNLNHFASLVDLGTLEYLQTVRSHPSFARTFVFLMSDHGLRFGDIRATEIGKLEERLPFLFVLAPSDFEKKYPVVYRNLVMNQKRLTSHYDIHATLWDILRKSYQWENYTNQDNVISKAFPGMTLFRRIPDTRTCKDAGILTHYCAGLQVHPAQINDEAVEAATRFVVQKLNKQLKKFPKCSQFTDYKIKKAKTKSGPEVMLQVLFQVFPGKALMEATVVQKGRSFQLAGDVSRINSYQGQIDCIEDVEQQRYCFCK